MSEQDYPGIVNAGMIDDGPIDDGPAATVTNAEIAFDQWIEPVDDGRNASIRNLLKLAFKAGYRAATRHE